MRSPLSRIIESTAAARVFRRARVPLSSWLALAVGVSLVVCALPAHAAATAPQWARFQKIATQFPLTAAEAPAGVKEPGQTVALQNMEPGPVKGLKPMARESDSVVWFGCGEGAARWDSKATLRWERWQYFRGPRWLADDDVQNIWVQPASAAGRAVWVRTRTGISKLEWRAMSLEEKAAAFDARIEARHVRHGFVADSHLTRSADFSSNQNDDNDNDGLWTAMYLGAQVYRYAVTKSPEAKARAQRAFNAIVRLETITPIKGFYARSFKSKNEPPPHGGEWHPTPDGEWVWKGDTSSDESVGHYYAHSVYYDLVANDAEKQQIRSLVAGMTDYLMANDYDMPDLDGKPTRWGQWSERYYKTQEGQYEKALRSLELLSFLKVTHHITGDAKYEAAYKDRIARGYADYLLKYRRWEGESEINFSDDELAYLSYEPLLRYEKDPALRAKYLDSLSYTFSKIRTDQNPLWNYITAASGGVKMDAKLKEESLQTLVRIPMDQLRWPVKNSHRQDIEWDKDLDRDGRRQLKLPVAPDERAVSKWNGNPYVPDEGGSGHSEDDGSYFLLPYWYGRMHGWVD